MCLCKAAVTHIFFTFVSFVHSTQCIFCLQGQGAAGGEERGPRWRRQGLPSCPPQVRQMVEAESASLQQQAAHVCASCIHAVPLCYVFVYSMYSWLRLQWQPRAQVRLLHASLPPPPHLALPPPLLAIPASRTLPTTPQPRRHSPPFLASTKLCSRLAV